MIDCRPLSDAELAGFRRRFEQANTPAARAAHMRREWKRVARETLPRRVRLRLWWQGHVDALAIWFAEHGRTRAAEALWRGGW